MSESGERQIDDGYEMRFEMAEKILRFLNIAKNIDAFGGKKAEEVLGDEESRRQFLLDISPEEYAQLIIGINGILRNRKREEWGMDGVTVVIGDQDDIRWDFPEFEDKQDLLNESLSAAKKMASENADLDDIGVLMSSALSATHLFNDGNGRTAKFILALVSRGYSSEHKQLFEEVLTSPDVSNFVNVGMIQGSITDIIEREIGMRSGTERFRFDTGLKIPTIDFDKSISAEKQALFERALKRSRLHLFEALFIEYKKNLSQYLNEDGRIEFQKMVLDLNDETIENVVKTWKQLKKKQVELIIDAIANPDKPEYQFTLPNNGDPKKESLFNIYKEKMKRTDPNIYKKIFATE